MLSNQTPAQIKQKYDDLEAENAAIAKRLVKVEAREIAVFAKAYRLGFFDGSGGTTAFQDEVDIAFAKWDENGRKTHLDVEALQD